MAGAKAGGPGLFEITGVIILIRSENSLNSHNISEKSAVQ